MDPEFWRARWEAGQIGFHEGRPNRYLERHAARLGSGQRVLVPLAGKAHDLAFLAGRGHDVIGVELSELAGRAFFHEHGLVPREEPRGEFLWLSSGGIQLFIGDFFAATRELLGPCDAFYDRAAIVALPADWRERYVSRLRSLVPDHAPGLVVTFEYDQSQMSGPPFDVPEAEVRRLFAGTTVELLAREPADFGRARTSGLTVSECCYAVDAPASV
jgi:thiopurine S-methyltransferase